MIYCLRLFFLFAAFVRLSAQPVAIEFTAHYGKVIRHSPDITIQNDQPVWGQEINLRAPTAGQKEWQQWQRFPVFGLAFGHFRLGEGAHGTAYSFLPNICVPIVRREKWLASFTLGSGFAYITKPYDYFTNPGQNAIGSHWNGATQFRLGGEVRLSPHFRALAGVGLTHFSNAGSALPNYGLNIPASYVAFAYSPHREWPLTRSGASKRIDGRRLGLQLQCGGAYVEHVIFDGPRYPVWAFSGSLSYAFNKVNRLMAGLDYEFNHSVYEWGLYTTGFPDEATAKRGAKRLAGCLGDEFLFGDFGVHLQVGIYLGDNMNKYVFAPFYEKLNVRYYLPAIFHTGIRPHFGICLKAHKTVAEFISINAGIAL